MPALLNPKHELFAQGLAKGLSADAAYQAAGYKKNRGNATRMKADESILRRLAELQSKAEAKVLLTLEDHMRELETLRELAKAGGQISAANTAEVKRGELMGYYVARSESTNTNYNISDKPQTEDEWEAEHGLAPANGASALTH
jgi:hypothetical protein